MAEAVPSSSSSTAISDAVVGALVKRGWSFADSEHIKAIITAKCVLLEDPGNTRSVADAVESELLNTDLRSIGAKSLPEATVLRKSSHLLGPKVLQISSVRDISKSTIEEDALKSSSRRLLRVTLTDGHSEMTAVEFSHIPSLASDVVPGTKVRLENRATVRGGIVCLSAQVLTVLGGVVQSLHEEWQMNKKYSAFSRETSQSQHTNSDGPPPFEKLQINASSMSAVQPSRSSQKSGSASRIHRPGDGEAAERLKNQGRNHEPSADGEERSSTTTSFTGKAEEKASTSDTRQKEVAELAPVQNQAAAQKLLQKMSQPSQESRGHRSRRGRGRGRQEEAQVFTLDEWEKRKADTKPSVKEELPNLTSDEELAWQLQNQFDLEDAHYVQESPQETEAERIRRSMFSFEKDNENIHGFGRGRGRGGRGRGRGRGRWRGRGRS